MYPAFAETLSQYRRAQWTALIVGAVCGVGLAVGAYFDLAQFLRAYLAVWLFFFGLTMGSMILLMIYHTTGGAWGFLIRRLLEGGVRTFPLIALGFLPIALGVRWLYPWAMPEAEHNALLRGQSVYMNSTFFYARAIGYFVLWGLLAWGLLGFSRRQDRLRKPAIANGLDTVSGIGLLLIGVSMHFASVDWVMALQPIYHSTIFGPIVVAGQILSAHALAIVVLSMAGRYAPIGDFLSAKVWGDLGNLLLSFVIVWSYLCWFQYLLSWIANLPYDVVWYAPRLRHGWQWVALFLVLFHFALPTLLLLVRRVKQNPTVLGSLAALILAAQLIFDVFQVLPPFHAFGWRNNWMILIAPPALGGIWVAYYLWRMGSRSVLPLYDYNEASAVQLRASEQHEQEWEEAFSHG